MTSTTQGVLAAIDLTLALLNRATAISSLVARAQSESRDLLPEEWAAIQSDDDRAREELVAAIAKAKGA
ncbi:MAG TPA: hypothetical protein VFA81_05745 [Burkholderiales bacterium]|nr:hypothetical protein [Burkholderiales bacterium]